MAKKTKDQVEEIETDEDQTEGGEPQTEGDEAGEVAEAEAPKDQGKTMKQFTPKGETRQLVITPKDADNELTIQKTLDVQFGEFAIWKELDKDSTHVVSGRYQVSYPRVIDGMEDNLVVMATDAAKAVAQVIKQSGRGEATDYVFDLDDDFYKQKVTMQRTDPDDVWKSGKFKDVREQLSGLAGEAEEAIKTAEEAKGDAQNEALKLAKVVQKAFAMVGNSRKALASWAKGEIGGNNPNFNLAKLGNGAHALYEAMALARLTAAQFEVLPATLTSGKAIDLHRSRAVARLGNDVTIKVTWPQGCHTKAGNRFPNLEGQVAIMRRIAEKAIGITGVMEMTLDAVAEAVNKRAEDATIAFIQDYGKSVNTYNPDEYNRALDVYGLVTVSDKGENLFNLAVAALNEVNNLEPGPKQTEALVKLYNENILMRKAIETCWKHAQTVKTEGENREILKQTKDNDDIVGQVGTSFAKLEPLAAAAHLFKLLNTHPNPPAVWQSLRGLVAQQGISVPEPKKEEAPEGDEQAPEEA